MPKAAPKKAASKAAPPPRPAPASKAAQAAAHQNRPAPSQQTRVPATVKQREVVDPATVANLPAFMRQDANMGKESIGRDDIETPRLKLMQGLSPEIAAYDGLSPGNFFHTAAEHIFDEPFRAVPIYMDKQYILWRPRDSGGGIIARAADGMHWSPDHGEFKVRLNKKDGGAEVTWRLAKTVPQSGLANWGTMNPNDPNSPPAATLMYSFVLAFPDEPDLMPAVLTFQRSSIRMARRLNTKLKTVRTPLFGSMFTFEAVEDTNSSGQKYFNIQATGAGLVEDEDRYNAYKQMHEQLRDKGLQIKDIETMQDEGNETGDRETPTF